MNVEIVHVNESVSIWGRYVMPSDLLYCPRLVLVFMGRLAHFPKVRILFEECQKHHLSYELLARTFVRVLREISNLVFPLKY